MRRRKISLVEWWFHTDFGPLRLPEVPPEFPTKTFRSRRYDEFTGKPYYITEEYPDYDSPLGKQWVAYERHIGALAQAVWEKGGNPNETNTQVPAFSEWVKDRL